MLNKNILINIFKKLLEEAKNSYEDFNAADGKIGDGDLGITILHGLEEINNNIGKFSDDMGANFMICSQAFVKKSGSSFGTLIAFSFINISKNLKGKTKCNHEDIVGIFEKLLEEAKKSYDDFNTADGKIGDGDLGVTILHGLKEINNNIDKFSDDMGANFMICSQSFVKKSGSSFGTLIAFSFMNISKNLKGKTECNHEDIVAIFETALKTILERGKASLGDKTIADSLDLIIKKLKDNQNYSEIFKSATKQSLVEFKGKKIKIGRARMFEDKTMELDDPGMYALNKLSQIF